MNKALTPPRSLVTVVLGLSLAFVTAVEASPRHLILVTVDTLRADALGTYGKENDPTPFIDALAAQGTLFEDAASVIGKTGPSFSTAFTSLYPPTHGARRNGVAMRGDVPTLAEALAAKNYDTAAFISNWTLRNGLSGIGRGFELYDETFNVQRNALGAVERDAASVGTSALEWLKSNRKTSTAPVFLWVHLSEPHTPYDYHPTFIGPEPTKEQRSRGWHKRHKYDSEVRFTDYWIGKIVEGVREALPQDDTLLVFFSDHGESLGEHGYWGHGKNAHWPNLRVPLILSGPNVPKGRRVSTPVSLVDLSPTLLDLLGLPNLPEAEGESLRELMPGDGTRQARKRYGFGDRATALSKKQRQQYDHPLYISLEKADVKAIFDFSKRKVDYYDLRVDPIESHVLKESPREERPPLGRQLSDWYKNLTKYEGDGGELTQEDIDQLRSLGYIGGP